MSFQHFLLILVSIYMVSIGAFFRERPLWHPRRLLALKPDSAPKIESLRIEYENLLMKYDLREAQGKNKNPELRRLGELHDFFESVEAISQIDEDLRMCAMQMNSDNEDTRVKAATYFNEFTQIKDSLEKEMNKMLE